MGGDEAVGEGLGGQVLQTHNPGLFWMDNAAAAVGNGVAESVVGPSVGWPRVVA